MSNSHRAGVAVGLGILLAGCTAGVAPTREARSSPSPTALPTASATAPATTPSAVTATPPPSPVVWPQGVVAYPVGSGVSPLPYLEFLPAGYGDGTKMPLLVFMHGVDEEADGSEASLSKILGLGIPALIADGSWPSDRPFVVLMPQEPVAKSSRCNFGSEIDQFLKYAVDRYEVDESRIYLTGISCGAIGVLDFLARSPETRVAADVPIASAPYESADVGARVRGGCAIAGTPTWFFHGALDDIIPLHYIEDAVAELRACTDPQPQEIKLTTYPDADHDSWSRTYDLSAGNDVYAWLLRHRSGRQPAP